VEQSLVIPPEVEAGFKGLVAEADALFGARHYAKYHFLLTVSDQVAHFVRKRFLAGRGA